MFEAFDFCNHLEFEIPSGQKNEMVKMVKSSDFESLMLSIYETYDFYNGGILGNEGEIEVFKCLQYISFLLEDMKIICQPIDYSESNEAKVIGCTWNCIEKLALNTRHHLERIEEDEDIHIYFICRDFWMVGRYLLDVFNQI